MTDEIEKKLLEEIEGMEQYDTGDNPRYEVTKGKLQQHRETKKWIEGLIDNPNYLSDNVWFNIRRRLKKQISGEKT